MAGSQPYGQRLVPQLVDEIALTTPERPFVSVPKSSNLKDGYRDVSYGEFAAAVNRCCWWIESHLGAGAAQQTIFYIGPLDIRYLIICIAACKTGHIAFFSSHRNSLDAHLSLLEASNCHLMCLPENAPIAAQQILARRSMRVLATPSLEHFTDSNVPAENYPMQGTFAEHKDRTFVILHTSGSTGIPKPVFCPHGNFASNDAHQMIPSLGGKPTTIHLAQNKRLFLAFPLFHAANLTWTIGYGIYNEMTCVLPPPGPMTADVVYDVHRYANVDASLLPPSIIMDSYNNPQQLSEMVDRLDFVAYVGGSLPKEIGDRMSKRLRLITLMGSTETMLLPIELNDQPEDWDYMPFSPFLGAEFRHFKDDLYELVVIRQKELEVFQGCFSTFPEKQIHEMKDLYQRHPTKPNAWRSCGRADDIISFNNAEKLNPVTMEGVISAHPLVKSALIAGHGEFQACLLVEPREYPSTKQGEIEFIDKIWPSVVEANKGCPAHGRVVKDYVALATRNKPIPRSGKGNIQRYAALQLYQDEIKALYASKKTEDERQMLQPPEPASPTQRPVTPTEPEDSFEQRVEEAVQRLLPGLVRQQVASAIGSAVGNMVSSAFMPQNNYFYPPQPTGVPPFMPQPTSVPPFMHPPPPPQYFASPPAPSTFATNYTPYGGHRMSGATTAVPGHNIGIHVSDEFTPAAPNNASSTTAKEAATRKPAIPKRDVSIDEVKSVVSNAISKSVYLTDVEDDTDLFRAGLDSLQVPVLVKEVNATLAKSFPGMHLVSQKLVHSNPTVKTLSETIIGSVH